MKKGFRWRNHQKMFSNARTPGELLFEEYLRSQGLTDFEYEKERPGKQRRPDYSVTIEHREYLFDVKDFEPEIYPIGFFSHDPYPRIREKINQVSKQFKEYEGWTCCAVLYNNGDHLLGLNDFTVMYGAMEGDFGVSMVIDVEQGRAIPGSEQYAFLDRGKMIRPHWVEPQNTKISALITVRKLLVGQTRYMRELRLMIRNKVPGPFPSESEVDFDTNEEHVGVIVWENRFAAVPFSRDLFRGNYDARWGLNGDVIERIYAGEGLLAFEALDPDEQ